MIFIKSLVNDCYTLQRSPWTQATLPACSCISSVSAPVSYVSSPWGQLDTDSGLTRCRDTCHLWHQLSPSHSLHHRECEVAPLMLQHWPPMEVWAICTVQARHTRLLDILLREGFKNKVKKKYGIFHTFLTPPSGGVKCGIYCQARVQVPNPKSQQAPNPDSKVRPSLNNPKTQFFGLGWHKNHMGHPPHHPPHPQLLSRKKCSGKKVQKIKVAQNNPPWLIQPKNWPDGQQEQGRGVVLHV